MSNIENLLQRYAESSNVKELISSCIQEKQARILCSGLIGSQPTFITAAISLQQDVSQIFVAQDKEEAAYIQNTLANLLPEKAINFFPDSFRRPLQFEEINSNNVLQRTEAINKVNVKNGKDSILITYPEALFEKVVDPSILDAQKIIISVGESLDVDTAVELLVEYGFERVDFVYEPGQFSIRG